MLRHTLGTNPAADPVVYREPDLLYRASVARSKDDRYLFFGSYSSNTSEVHFVPADRPTQPLRVVQPRMEGWNTRWNTWMGGF